MMCNALTPVSVGADCTCLDASPTLLSIIKEAQLQNREMIGGKQSTPSLCAYNVDVLELPPRRRQIDQHRVRINNARTDNHNQTNSALAHMSNMACARALLHMACQFATKHEKQRNDKLTSIACALSHGMSIHNGHKQVRTDFEHNRAK